MIRLLGPADAEAFAKLRQASLLDSPLSFASSPADDMAASLERTRDLLQSGSQNVVFGAFAPGLVGCTGLYRDRHLKAAHKVHLWGMYVDAKHRGQGLGRGLLDAAVQHARSLAGIEWVHLSVSSSAPVAQKMYEIAGFQRWGSEPDALRFDGTSTVEHHMALRLGLAPTGDDR